MGDPNGRFWGLPFPMRTKGLPKRLPFVIRTNGLFIGTVIPYDGLVGSLR